MTAVTNTPKNKPALIEFRRGCYPPAMAFSGVARNASKEGGGLALIDATMPELNTLNKSLKIQGMSANYCAYANFNNESAWARNTTNISLGSVTSLNPLGVAGHYRAYTANNGDAVRWGFFRNVISLAFDEAYPIVFSCYVRKPSDATSKYFTLLLSNDVPITVQSYCRFKIEGNTIIHDLEMVRSGVAGQEPLAGGSGSEYVGDGWFRVWVWAKFNKAVSYTRSYQALIYPSYDETMVFVDRTDFWGGQVEYGTYPSAPKITNGSQITAVKSYASYPVKLGLESAVFFKVKVPNRFVSTLTKYLFTLTMGTTDVPVLCNATHCSIAQGFTSVGVASANSETITGCLVISSDGMRLVLPDGTSLPRILPTNFTEFDTLTLGNKTITEYNSIEFNKLLVYGVKPSDAEIAQMLKML